MLVSHHNKYPYLYYPFFAEAMTAHKKNKYGHLLDFKLHPIMLKMFTVICITNC